MQKSDFYYDLPKCLIAQAPLKSRDKSRLLCMAREAGNTPYAVEHRFFYELPELLSAGDCLVLNDSRVLPARLIGTRSTGGPAEVLLLRDFAQGFAQGRTQETQGDGSLVLPFPRSHKRIVPLCEPNGPAEPGLWECLVKPGKKVREGTKLIFGEGELTATVIDVLDNGNRLIEFRCQGSFPEVLEKLGKMPLPPYIQNELQDPGRYQTVYSATPGSAAAPTAGLHFTHELLERLRSKGISTCFITLHVGPGTFRPVKTGRVEDHVMHSEYFTISRQAAQAINRTKENGGRIIAVGTTSCRTLETAADESGNINASSGQTDIFIYPGYEFKCIDGLITNFHLPESTLIMLVSAFAGRERVLAAYNEAIAGKYRFYSLGDAMLII